LQPVPFGFPSRNQS